MGRRELLYLLLGIINVIALVFLISVLGDNLVLIVVAAGVFLEMFTTYKIIKTLDIKLKKPIEDLHRELNDFFEKGKLEIDENDYPKEYHKLVEQIKRLENTVKKIKIQNYNITKEKETTISSLERDLTVQKEATLKVLKEIDEEKELSQAQARELEKFQLAVNEASDHIVITDNEGYVIYTNMSGQTITGYLPNEILGTKAGVLWGGQMDQSYYQNMWNTIKTEKKVFKGEITNKRKDGSLYIAEISISPILDENNDVLFFVSIQRDITKAKEVDKMKTEFISLASHQLRAPLSAIRWGLESLLDGLAGPMSEQQTLFTKDAYDSTTRMVDLVNGLLNVSRIESGRLVIEPIQTDIVELVQTVIKEVSIAAIERKQELKVSIQENIPEISLDPKLIRNVYLNFLTNAIKYTPEGGKILLEITTNETDLVTMIKDNGIGIPEKAQEKLFQKFFRADNVRKVDTDGTGLGLYLVKSIIEAVEGKIWYESKENVGSTFWFTIPLSGMKKKEGQVSLEN